MSVVRDFLKFKVYTHEETAVGFLFLFFSDIKGTCVLCRHLHADLAGDVCMCAHVCVVVVIVVLCCIFPVSPSRAAKYQAGIWF